MALFRRNKTWWSDFSVNGVRYRMSLDTTDWREALSREKEKIAQAHAGKLSPAGQSFARLAFSEALDRYLADRSAHVDSRSHRSELDYAKLRRAEGWVTAKGDFRAGYEDAYFYSFLRLNARIAREHKRSFLKVGFASHILHF